MITETRDLLKLYPTIPHPIRCENGCGAVIDLMDALHSYDKDKNGDPKLICRCCASEKGHLFEDEEEPEDSPTCKRRHKKTLR